MDDTIAIVIDDNASILAKYMIVFFVGVLIMLGTILYYNYKSAGNLTFILSSILFIIAIFGVWGVYYQNTGKPFVLYQKDTVNMTIQHLSFILMIAFVVFYTIYMGYLGYNYEPLNI